MSTMLGCLICVIIAFICTNEMAIVNKNVFNHTNGMLIQYKDSYFYSEG